MDGNTLSPADVMLMTKQHCNRGMAATFRVQGIISYVPCNGGCCTKSQPLSGTFTIPIASATAPTNVSIAAGATVNAIAASGCQKCSRTFVSETPLSLTVTVAG